MFIASLFFTVKKWEKNLNIHQQECGLTILVYPYDGSLINNKEQTTDTCGNMDDSRKQTQRNSQFHLHEVQEQEKLGYYDTQCLSLEGRGQETGMEGMPSVLIWVGVS